jgi:hypothetical protein
LRNAPEPSNGFGNGTVGVTLGKLFGSGREDRNFTDARLPRAIQALQVWHQHREARAGLQIQSCHYLGGIGQLRYPPRADKAGGFNNRQPAGRKPFDQLDLDGRGHDGWFILQAIARADLHHGERSAPALG